MFKVGDRVRVTEKFFQNGKTGTVTRVEPSKYVTADGRKTSQNVSVNIDGYHVCSFFDINLELIEKTFNIAAATDQELADEYRRRRTENVNLFNELVKRGYTVTFENVPIRRPVYGDDIKITRQETVSL